MKGKRQEKILELINMYDIETQDELTKRLQEAGFSSTQGTISRDIRELKLTKVAGENGRQRYVILQNENPALDGKFIPILKSGFVRMDMAQNILVIRTVSGMAMAVAAALDAMHFQEVVGCIAGDDTIMCAVRSSNDTILLMDKIRKLLNSEE